MTTSYVFSFSNEDDKAHCTLTAYIVDGEVVVTTNSVLSAIQDLDDQLLELYYDQVNTIITELIGTLHTRLNDPEAAAPPDGWTMVQVPAGVLVDQTYGAADIPEGWVPVQVDDTWALTSAAFQVDDEWAAKVLAELWGTEAQYFPGTMSPEGYEYELGSVEHEPGDWAVRLP